MSYRDDARSDAQDTATEFRDNMLEMYVDDGKVSDDLLNDYPNGDAYHHESHVDTSYNLTEAAEVLDELDEYEETDEGLWEGLKPRDAISAQAAYTYGNAVYALWRELVEEINDDVALSGIKDDYDGVEDAVDDELTEHRDEAEEGDEYNDEDDNFDEDKYSPPFERDEEIEKRQAAFRSDMGDRIDEIIKAYYGE